MTQPGKKVVVIGGGITGLSAAFYLQKFLKEQSIPFELTVIEQSRVLGGKIQTLRKDGFIIEKGPDSFLSRKTPILDLTKELGIEHELVPLNPKAKKTYIVRQGKLHPMPAGLIMGIPTEVTPFMKTGLITPLGKLRAGLDLVLQRRRENMDESLGHFIERRLGKEVLESIAEPLLAGIYAGDTRQLSLRATFPQFHAIEKKYRSMILGMVASRKQTASDPNLPEIAKKSMFLSYRNGLFTLIEELEEALTSATILMGERVHSIQQIGDYTYQVCMEDGQVIEAEHVILATQAFNTIKLLPKLSSASLLEQTPYVSVANIVLAFEEKDVEHLLDGSGFLVPRKENRSITACTWTSSKWLHTAPQGNVLLRCYIGRAGDEGWVHLSDEQLLERATKDLFDLIGLQAKPLFYEVNRWEHSMPQYTVHHLERLQTIRNELQKEYPGIWLTGSAYQGIGIPDCIRQGKETAEQVVASL